MRLYVYDVSTRLAVLRAMCRVPENVRRIAQEQVTWVGVGRATAGMSLRSSIAEGSLICVGERDEAEGTAGHELAHVALGHSLGTVEAEREACALARRWGFGGDSADPALAAALKLAEIAAEPEMRALTSHGVVRVECRCGSVCSILAPTVAGMAAEIGVECETCGWVEVMELRELVRCPDCRERAVVLWTPDATPSRPVATWTCDCGTNVSLRLQREPNSEPEPECPPRPPVPEELWHADRAARQLPGIEAALRRLGDVEPSGIELESLRSGVQWARSLLLRSGRELPEEDPCRAAVRDAGDELTAAAERLARRDFAAAADAVAWAATALAGMLPTAAVQPRSPADVTAESNP